MSTPPLIAGRELTAQFGWVVIPVGMQKQPLLNSQELAELYVAPPTTAHFRDWLRRFPHANVALVCGALSGVLVLDVEQEGLLHFMDEPMGRTVYTYTPNGGMHFYFGYEPGIRSMPIDDGDVRLADIRSDKMLVMLPPSYVGRRYEWGLSPWEADPNEVPPIVDYYARPTTPAASRSIVTELALRAGRAQGGERGRRSFGHASRSEEDLSQAVQMLAAGARSDEVRETLFNSEAAIDRRRQRGAYADRTLVRAEEWVAATIPNAKVVGLRQQADGVTLALTLLDGPFAGRRLGMALDWPPTDRSIARWLEIGTILGEEPAARQGTLDLRRLPGLRFSVQLIVHAGGRLGLASIYPPRTEVTVQ